MIRRELLRASMMTPLAHWLGRWRWPALAAAMTETSNNAATLYRKAFEWSEGLSSEDADRIRKAQSITRIDRDLEALIRQAHPALELIREAAKINRCQWSTDVVTNDDIGKGHLNGRNVNVIRMAALSARWHVEAGRIREALDDAFAGLALAHRIGSDGVLIAHLFEFAGETSVFNTLGRIMPRLRQEGLDDLSRRLAALPPPEPASAMIGPESRYILGMLRTKLMAMGPHIGGADWEELGFKDEEVPTLQRLTGGDRDKLLAHVEASGPAFAELARRLDLPRPGCRAALDEFTKAEPFRDTIAAGLVESAWGTRHARDRVVALRAILRAGIVLVKEGEQAFLKEADPFGSGPFSLERRGKGYLIRSALNDEGKPEVSLEIGETD